MNKYKKATARRIFFKEFQLHKKQLLEDRKLMKHFKSQFRHHTAYSTRNIDRIINKWTKMTSLDIHFYLIHLEKQVIKEMGILHKRGKQYK